MVKLLIMQLLGPQQLCYLCACIAGRPVGGGPRPRFLAEPVRLPAGHQQSAAGHGRQRAAAQLLRAQRGALRGLLQPGGHAQGPSGWL